MCSNPLAARPAASGCGHHVLGLGLATTAPVTDRSCGRASGSRPAPTQPWAGREPAQTHTATRMSPTLSVRRTSDAGPSASSGAAAVPRSVSRQQRLMCAVSNACPFALGASRERPRYGASTRQDAAVSADAHETPAADEPRASRVRRSSLAQTLRSPRMQERGGGRLRAGGRVVLVRHGRPSGRDMRSRFGRPALQLGPLSRPGRSRGRVGTRSIRLA